MKIFPKEYAAFYIDDSLSVDQTALGFISYMLVMGWNGDVIAAAIDRTGNSQDLIPALRLLEDLFDLTVA